MYECIGLLTVKMRMRKHSGNGTITNNKGDVYEGESKDAEPHGKGKMTFKDGSVYEGEWVNARDAEHVVS